jgi:hypothetical protein
MKMKKYKFIILLFFICCSFTANAQNRLSGKITDRSDNPVAGALIDFNNGLVRTTSDGNGQFSFNYPDTLARRSISISSFGYKNKTMFVNRNQQNLNIVLIDSVYQLGAANISASRNGRFSDYSAQTLHMSTLDILTNPAAMGDIIGNMRVLPGVQSNDNDGRLIIQGGNPNESQVYINDLIVANPYSSSAQNTGVRSRFSSDLFSGTVLQSGGFNAEFGQALSGIINLNTKEREQITPKTDISLMPAAPVLAGFTHIDRKQTYAYRADIMYLSLALADKILAGGVYDWKKPYQSLSADIFLTKEFSTNTKLTAQFNGSRGGGLYSCVNIDGDTLANNVKQTYIYTQLNFYQTFNKRLSLSAAANVVIDKLSGTEVEYKNDKLSRQNIWSHSKITFQYKSKRITNRTGVEFIFNPYSEKYTLADVYNSNVHSNIVAAYNDTKIFILPNFTVSAGLRSEYSIFLRKCNVAPRLYAAYKLNAENVFSIAAGNYFQVPSFDYLKITNDIDFVGVQKVTASYGYVKNESKLQVDVYCKKYINVVAYQQGQFIDNSGKGKSLGADVFLKSRFKNLEYWLSYSYNNTSKQYDDFSEAVAPPYIAQHSFNATLKYWFAQLRSMLGASYFVSTGTPYYSSDFPRTLLGKTPYHSRLDISWSFLPAQWIVVHFGYQNVFGRKNIYGYEYSKNTAGLRRAITSAQPQFFVLGVFVTLSRSKTLNQLNNL